MTRATFDSYCMNDKWGLCRWMTVSFCIFTIMLSFSGMISYYHDKAEYDMFFEHAYKCIINSIEYENCPDIIINTTIEELDITIREQVNFIGELKCNKFITNNILHPRVTCSYFEDKLVLSAMIDISAPFWFDVSLTALITAITILIIMFIHFKLSVYENKWASFKHCFTRENKNNIIKGLEARNNALEARNIRLNDLERQNTTQTNKIKDLENQLKATAPPIYKTPETDKATAPPITEIEKIYLSEASALPIYEFNNTDSTE